MPDLSILDPDACYRATAGRDSRWDGRMYLGVVTTGIYCRPSCPARTPLQKNCLFFATAAAAVASGFRACKRCRPDALPGSRDWDTRGDLSGRAVRMIRDGVIDEVGVAGLASRLAVSERHLLRVLVEEVGATPLQLNTTRRAHAARTLIEQTAMSLADVAFASGFGSVRQFNDVMRSEFGVAPSTYRRPRGSEPVEGAAASDRLPEIVLRLRYRPPFETAALRRFLAAHAVAGLETSDEQAGEHSRVIAAAHGPALVTIAWDRSGGNHLVVRMRLASLADLMPVVSTVRRWLDLDADPALTGDALAADPLLAPLIAKRPGLRLPGAIDGSETALFTVLGQQVSLAAARTFQARLVARFGTPLPGGFMTSPDAAAIAAAETEPLRAALGLTTSRVRALQALARALADGLRLVPGQDRKQVRAALLELPGIGPWTADYVTLRCLGDPDAFPADDLVLKRALGVSSARAALDRSATWSPWRGYALMHLWTESVYS
ncbi:helix-turn-helix domain-containing protein [Microbacterium sp. STN6]|uniref:DNA-3-methyladenine glycosylase 2 family protein n=1 Tax=Microbacterium sp. STN6 TaxID=2995588 RepID=UPI002260F6C5|nr:AlkA N-terminal domain-containing protein [Microbacterium sp. STN6]MCX7521418.1 helix-turn-helix domain-containing protein [Microbacterium sp. STN6]